MLLLFCFRGFGFGVGMESQAALVCKDDDLVSAWRLVSRGKIVIPSEDAPFFIVKLLQSPGHRVMPPLPIRSIFCVCVVGGSGN